MLNLTSLLNRLAADAKELDNSKVSSTVKLLRNAHANGADVSDLKDYASRLLSLTSQLGASDVVDAIRDKAAKLILM